MSVRFALRGIAFAALLLSAQATAQVAQTPGQVLSGFPSGGPAMVAQVQVLMNADRTNLAAIIAFAKTATEDQRKAIGQALAQVAKASNDPAYSTQIQQQVAAAGIPELSKAYSEAAGDTGTASNGGGGGGGGGGPTAGGPPTGGPNNGFNIPGSTFANTQASTLTSGGLSGGGFSSVSPQ